MIRGLAILLLELGIALAMLAGFAWYIWTASGIGKVL